MRRNSLMRLQLTRLFDRHEIKIIFTLTLCMVCISFIEMCFMFYRFDYAALPQASYGWVGNMDQLLLLGIRVWANMFILFFAGAVYADALLLDRKRGVVSFLAVRSTSSRVLASYALATFVGGFLVAALPLLIGQLLSFVVFPFFGQPYGFAATLNEGFSSGQFDLLASENVLFPQLYFNNMYLLNFIYVLYTGVVSGLAAVGTFVLSLYRNFPRLILLGILPIVNIATAFVLPRHWQILYYTHPSATLAEQSYAYFFGTPLILLVLCLAGLWFAQKTKRDVFL